MTMINIDWLFGTLVFFGWFYHFLVYPLGSLIKYCKKKKEIQYIDPKNYHITIMIPCRNEERVINKTLENIESLDFNKKTNYKNMEIIVINDGSTDRTKEIIETYDPKLTLHILNVDKKISGKGKSEALNRGFAHLKKHSNYSKNSNHLVCVFDADGLPDLDLIEKMCLKFNDKEIGSINSSIRIYNRHTNFLCMMQDIEFNLIARYLNHARGYIFSNSFMGGNGQFMRYTVLDSLDNEFGYIWKRSSLTEDLDIGMRILFLGWKTHHLLDGFVHQQGLTKLRSLIRQRNRWAWGTTQTCFKFVFKTLLFRQKLGFFTKLDITISLLTPIVIVILAPLSLTFLVLNLTDVIDVQLYSPEIASWILVTLWVLFPLCVLIHHRKEYLLMYIPSHFFGYIFYNIILLPSLMYGLLSVVTCRIPTWSKTKRIDTFETETQLIQKVDLDPNSNKNPPLSSKRIFKVSPKNNTNDITNDDLDFVIEPHRVVIEPLRVEIPESRENEKCIEFESSKKDKTPPIPVPKIKQKTRGKIYKLRYPPKHTNESINIDVDLGDDGKDIDFESSPQIVNVNIKDVLKYQNKPKEGNHLSSIL